MLLLVGEAGYHGYHAISWQHDNIQQMFHYVLHTQPKCSLTRLSGIFVIVVILLVTLPRCICWGHSQWLCNRRDVILGLGVRLNEKLCL